MSTGTFVSGRREYSMIAIYARKSDEAWLRQQLEELGKKER
jgi:hypothetical protein